MSTRTGKPEHRAPHTRAIRNYSPDMGSVVPRHRQGDFWKLIAETTRYKLYEHTGTGQTQTRWKGGILEDAS